MATVTATTVVYGDARIDPCATITRVFSYVSSLTLSSGDVVYHPYWRIPNHAVITSVKVAGRTVDGTNIIVPCIRQYDSASAATDLAFGSLTLSVAGRIGDVIYSSAGDSAHLPYVFSASDDASVHFGHIVLKMQANASATGSVSVDCIIQYTMNK